MPLVDIVPIQQHPMSIYTAIFFTFGGIAIGLITRRLFERADNADKRIGDLEVKSAETYTTVKNIENKTTDIDNKINTMLIDAQQLNAEVIKHMIEGK